MIARMLLCMFMVASLQANAYEISTHALITNKAHAQSNVVDFELLQVYGIEQAENPFGDTYYDVLANAVRPRIGTVYGTKLIKALDETAFSVSGWLMRGAIREDDIPDYYPFSGENPQDDPDGKIPRVFNHFYLVRKIRG